MSEASNTPNLKSTESIQSLSVGELESLSKKIVKETLQNENYKFNSLKTQKFLETFGSWKDTRTAEEIIEEIYSSRGVNKNNL